MPRRSSDRDDEFRVAEALLRSAGWTGPHGLEERKINGWLRRLFRDGGLGAEFDLKHLASDCDLVYYARNTAGDRREFLDPIVRHYVQRMRDAVVRFVELFWGLPQHQKYVNDGLSDEQIFEKVVRFMVYNDIYPVWSDRYDPEGKWKLMDLDAYAWLRKTRADAIVSEVEDKATEMEVMKGRFQRALPGKFEPSRMVKDGSFIDHPRIGPGEGVACPVDDCDQRYPNLRAWMRHCLRDHPDWADFRDRRDNEPRTGLDALFDNAGDGEEKQEN